MKQGLLILFFLMACNKELIRETVSQESSRSQKVADITTLNWNPSPEYIQKQCQNALKQLDITIQKIVSVKHATFENTLQEADQAFSVFNNQVQILDFYRYVMKNAAIQEAAKKCYEDSERLHLSIMSRMDFFKAVQTIDEAGKITDPVEKYLLDDYLYSFKENGMYLTEKKREELLKLRNELIDIEATYTQVLNDWHEVLDFTKKELEGLPSDILSHLEASKKPGKDYIVTMKYPDVNPALMYVKNANVRKKIYASFKNRGGKENSERLAHAIDLRLKIAKLLGYKDYASYKLEDNMAKDTKTVTHFLSDLQSRLRKRTEAEFQRLLELKRRDLSNPRIRNLDPWDVSYYDNLLMNEKYNVNGEEIKKYFPADKTITAMLKIYQTLLDVDFEELPHASVWNSDVKAFRVVDHQSKEAIGQFYMDLFPRDGKYGHAANFGLINGYLKADSHYVQPISAIVANFNKGTKDEPGLWTHDEVETLFHEFGHVMHHVLSKARFGNFSGTSVKRDFVEAPSQMMENWIWEKSILKQISSHYKTGVPMPDALIDQLLKTRFFGKGMYYTRQIFYASVDMTYHTLQSTKNLDVTKMYHKLFQDIYILKPSRSTRPEASFEHLMGGYDAGYYGYLWSEVYSRDMFTRFQSEGLLNPQTGREYRKTILEQGGSYDPMELLTKFLKRKPNNEAFVQLMDRKS